MVLHRGPVSPQREALNGRSEGLDQAIAEGEDAYRPQCLCESRAHGEHAVVKVQDGGLDAEDCGVVDYFSSDDTLISR